MRKLAAYMFNNCTKLKTVTLPDSLTEIDEGAFTNTAIESLEHLNIEKIGKEAFKGCTKLKRISLPKIKTIGQEAFADCTSLLKFDNDVTSIGEGAFKNCSSLEEVNIRKLTLVSASAFENAVKLTKVSLNTETTSTSFSIETRDFANCVLLNEIDLSRVRKIKDEAFKNCNALTSLDLSVVTEIGKEAFSIDNETPLAAEFEVIFASINSPTCTTIGEKAFYNRTNYVGVLEFNIGKLKTCGNYAFGKTGITNFILHLKTTSTLKLPTTFADYWNGKEEGGTETIPYVIESM